MPADMCWFYSLKDYVDFARDSLIRSWVFTLT